MHLRSVVVTCIATTAGALLISACSASTGTPGYVENTYPITPGHYNHAVTIGAGRIGTDSWKLTADVDGEGQLCMGIVWSPAVQDSPYGCGFGSNLIDDDGRGTEPTSAAEATDGTALAYGPAPAGAVTVTLTTPAISGTTCRTNTLKPRTVVITHRLPPWYPVHGGWFVAQVPAAAVTCVIDTDFHNASGKSVPEPKNF